MLLVLPCFFYSEWGSLSKVSKDKELSSHVDPRGISIDENGTELENPHDHTYTHTPQPHPDENRVIELHLTFRTSGETSAGKQMKRLRSRQHPAPASAPSPTSSLSIEQKRGNRRSQSTAQGATNNSILSSALKSL